MLPQTVIEKLETRFGRELRYSSDVEELSRDIYATTRQTLSINTLKRMLGIVVDVKTPRLYSLDVIAHYLGFDNWDRLIDGDSAAAGSEFDSVKAVYSRDLKKGCVVRLSYTPGRKLVLTYAGSDRYVVSESIYSKLEEGDVVTITEFLLGRPLHVREVTRGDRSLGHFTAARISGLISLTTDE